MSDTATDTPISPTSKGRVPSLLDKWRRNRAQRRIERLHQKDVRHPDDTRFNFTEESLLQGIGSPEEHGMRDGAAGLPAANAVMPSDFESRVIWKAEELSDRLRNTLGKDIREQESRFGDAKIDTDPHSLAAIRRTKHEIERPRCIGEELDELNALKLEENSTHCKLRLFRKENRLEHRPPHAQDGWFTVGIILAMLLAEGALNGLILKDAQPGGAVGSIFLGVLFAFANIALGLVAGLVLGRNALHVRWYRRMLAWLGLPLALGAVVVLNGWFGMVRNFAVRNHDLQASLVEVAKALHADPWLLVSDPSVWPWLAVGVFFALVAFWEGMHIRDPYPGYSTVWARYQQAKAVLDEKRRVARERLNRIYDEANAEMLRIIENNAEAMKAFHTGMREYQRTADTYNRAVSRLHNLTTMLVFGYRRANMQYRADAPPPRYFQLPVKLDLQPARFTSLELEKQYREMAGAAEHFEKGVLVHERHHLGELRLFALSQLDQLIRQALGEPVNELDPLPPLHPVVVAPLSIQPKE